MWSMKRISKLTAAAAPRTTTLTLSATTSSGRRDTLTGSRECISATEAAQASSCGRSATRRADMPARISAMTSCMNAAPRYPSTMRALSELLVTATTWYPKCIQTTQMSRDAASTQEASATPRSPSSFANTLTQWASAPADLRNIGRYSINIKISWAAAFGNGRITRSITQTAS